MMKVCVIVGTRPEIIKMCPLIRYLEQQQIDYFILHTGQHYSIEMDKIFFDELELPLPKYNLEVGSSTHGKQIALILEKTEQILMEEKPEIVFVEGDTNSVLAGALAAAKLKIKVGHVEAGLRSYNREMPEEVNRIATDHISDLLFCPTEQSQRIVLSENIDQSKIFVTGNTIVDSVLQNIELSLKKSEILQKLNINEKEYFLLTMHRQENVDSEEKISSVFNGLKRIAENYSLPIIFPLHPRTKKQIEKYSINVPAEIKIVEPLGFLDFLQLEAKAKLILTDSGGVQEEACILRIPCVTLREDTERPETISVGANILVGTNEEKIFNGVEEILSKPRDWQNPFGDGRAAEKIINITLNALSK
jgi:UDP-N-acetylglucosamine 2-epimerase (non-hydrolysing)